MSEVKQEEHIVCNRCGQCCYFMVDGKKKKCKHLVLLKNGKSLCRIYSKRLGKVLYSRVKGEERIQSVCMMREEVYYNYPNCPFNKEEQQVHPCYR